MSNLPEKEQPGSPSDILLYQTEDRKTQIEVRLEGETVWLSQKQNGRSVPNDCSQHQHPYSQRL